jgi:hypothetical protein
MPVRQPYAGVNYIPYSGTMNLATGIVAEKTGSQQKISLAKVQMLQVAF